MRIGAILVTYAFDPEPLFASVAGTKHTVKWYIHHHGDDLQLEQKLVEYASGGNVDLHLHRLNRELSRSWNDGIESSIKDGNDYTLLLNDDLFFYEGAFDAFIEFVVENPDVGIAIAHGFEPHIGVVTQQGAACCAFSKSVIETIGYFDENFLLAYCEDTDYWQRAMKSGVVILEDRRKLVEHYRSKTYRTSSPEKQQRIMRAIEANEAYFIRKWGGLWKGEPSDIKFELPFNDGRFGLKIDSATRAAPYGYPYDRAQGFSENMVHVHSSGDVWFPQGQVCGKAGEGLWLEGLLLANDSAETAELEYAAILEGEAFTDLFRAGEFLGTRGVSLPLRGLRVRLTGKSALTHEVSGACTFLGGATLGPTRGTEIVLVTDDYRPIESFQLKLNPVGQPERPQGGNENDLRRLSNDAG